MTRRILAVFHDNDSMADNVMHTVNSFFESKCAAQVYVFTSEPKQEFNFAAGECTCANVAWPRELSKSTQQRNWINQYFKLHGFDGKLHVLEDTTVVLRDPSAFLEELECAMNVLDYSVWFSTVCDNCNYVYSKYISRMTVNVDMPNLQLALGSKILFTSHCNTQWIAYDFSRASDDLLKLDEDFSVPMYYIIEYLARRRNTKPENSLYFMNWYMTTSSELGVFKSLADSNKTYPEDIMRAEDAKFKSKNINCTSESNLDDILETLYMKLSKKL